MAGELDSLVIRLAAETADAQRQIKRMEGSVDRFAKRTDKNLRKTDRSFQMLSAQAASMGSRIIAAFAVTAIVSWTDSVARATNTMADMADTVAMTTREFQELRTLGAAQGMGFEKIDAAMRGFAVRMGEARGQAGGFYEFLQRHLPTLSDQLLATKSQAEALAVLERAFERLENPSHRAALANQAFGETGLQLAPVLAQLGSQIDEAKAKASQYGTVISEETIAETRKIQAEVDLLNLKFKKLSAEGLVSATNMLKNWQATLRSVLSFLTLDARGAMAEAITAQGPQDEAAVKGMANRLAGFAAPALQSALNGQKPLEWQVKLTNATDPEKWRTSVAAGDPFKDIYERARQDHDEFIAHARDSWEGVAGVIESSISQPLQDAFAGNLQDTRTYLRELVTGLANAVVQALVLKPIIESIKNSLGGAGGLSGSGLGSLFSGIFGGFRASGGPVSPGKAYVVGERGPELMVPNSAGTVMPNGSGGGGGSTVYNIDARGAEPGVEQRIYQVLAELERTRPAAPRQLASYTNRYPLRAAA